MGGFICLVIGAVLIAGSLGLIAHLKKNLQSLRFSAKGVEPADNEILSYLMVYMFPLITAEYSTENWWIWIGVALVICLIIAKTYGNQFNPVLTIFGWHHFKATDREGRTSILITRNKMYSPEDEIFVGKITEYVLIDKDKNRR